MGPPLWTASAIYLYPCRRVFCVHISYSIGVGVAVSFFILPLPVAGERVLQAKECSAIARVRSRRGAWLREGRRVRERRRRCLLPTMVDQQRAEIELVQLEYVCRGVEKTMRVSLRSRDAVRGAVGKYQPVFVIRRIRDGSASRVTGRGVRV